MTCHSDFCRDYMLKCLPIAPQCLLPFLSCVWNLSLGYIFPLCIFLITFFWATLYYTVCSIRKNKTQRFFFSFPFLLPETLTLEKNGQNSELFELIRNERQKDVTRTPYSILPSLFIFLKNQFQKASHNPCGCPLGLHKQKGGLTMSILVLCLKQHSHRYLLILNLLQVSAKM